MTLKKGLLIVLVFLAPLVTLLGALYELRTGKAQPAFYFFLVAFPVALAAALKALTESLRPARLTLEINASQASIHAWTQQLRGSSNTQSVTDIKVPIRITNNDDKKPIDILDVKITALDNGVSLQLPELIGIQQGGQQHWVFPLGNEAFPELFNAGKKTIAPEKIEDYVIGLREINQPRQHYKLRLDFRDNFRRKYASEVQIQVATATAQ